MIHTDGVCTIANAGPRITLPDVLITNEGSIFLVQPVSLKGREWIEEHVDDVASEHWGDSLVVEHGYIVDLVDGMHDDGLVVR